MASRDEAGHDAPYDFEPREPKARADVLVASISSARDARWDKLKLTVMMICEGMSMIQYPTLNHVVK